MNTQIITQKFFKDSSGNIRCIDIMLMNQDCWESEIQEDWTAVSKDEADKIANPQPTKAELIEQVETQKQYLIAEVNAETQLLQTKFSLKRIKPDELKLLNAWLDYLELLEAVDTSTAPDIDWPKKPR